MKKRGFSLLELSIVLIVIAIIIAMITQSSDVLTIARLAASKNMTKSSVVNDIPGLILWLETTSDDSFDTKDIDDGTAITNWNDIKSSNIDPYIAIQTTVDNKPIYKKAVINDLPGLQFDGTNDFLSIPNFQANAYMTLFVVGKFASDVRSFFIEHSGNVASIDGFYFYGYGNFAVALRRSTLITNPSNIGWFKSSIPSIGVMRYDGANLSYKRNGNSFINLASSAITNTMVNTTLYIGSRAGTSLFSNGYFGEIIMYDRALSDSEVADVVSYLTKKWQIE